MNKITNQIYINKPKNFSFKACLQFLDRGYNECLYRVNEWNVSRLIRLSSGLILIQVSDDEKQIIIGANQHLSEKEKHQLKYYVIDWFDLKRDLSGFYRCLNQHPETVEYSTQYFGLRLMGIVDLFEALCWCVIGQQINLTFAHKVKARLVHEYGDSLYFNGTTYSCFPTPEVLINADKDTLLGMQFSKQKVNYIHTVSAAFCLGELNKKKLLMLSKPLQMEKLLAIKGIGPWTANYVSMKCLRDMTCIAYGDTGLSSALRQLYNTDKKPDKKTIDALFKPFAGWESYFNFYLWKSLS